VDEKTYVQQLGPAAFPSERNFQRPASPGEDTGVEKKFQRASNAAKLLQLCQAALDLLGENDHSLPHAGRRGGPHLAGIAARGRGRGRAG